MNSQATSVVAWRLYRSAFSARLVYLREIGRTSFWEFRNTIGQQPTLAIVRHYRAFVHDDETGDNLQRPCAYSVHAAADDAIATVDDFGQCVITCPAA